MIKKFYCKSCKQITNTGTHHTTWCFCRFCGEHAVEVPPKVKKAKPVKLRTCPVCGKKFYRRFKSVCCSCKCSGKYRFTQKMRVNLQT